MKVLSLKEMILCIGTTNRNNPINVEYTHYKAMKMVPPFKHEIWEEEEIFCEAISYEVVLAHVVRTPQVDSFLG
jgi:hypothetical protein